MAFREPEHLGDGLLERTLPPRGPQVLAHGIARQPVEAEGIRVAPYALDEAAGAWALQLRVPIAADEHQRCGVDLSRQEFQQRQRVGIRGVQVFENQQDGRAARRREQQGRHRIHEPEARLLRLETGGFGSAGHELRNELGDRGRQVRLLIECRARMFDGQHGTQDLNPGPVGRRAARFPCETPVDGRIGAFRLGRKFRQQAALADAGLAADEAHGTAPQASGLPGLSKGRGFLCATDERAVPAGTLCVHARPSSKQPASYQSAAGR